MLKASQVLIARSPIPNKDAVYETVTDKAKFDLISIEASKLNWDLIAITGKQIVLKSRVVRD